MGSQNSQKALQAAISPSLRDQGPQRTWSAPARLPGARMSQAHQFPSSGLRTSIVLSSKDIGEYRAAHRSFPSRSPVDLGGGRLINSSPVHQRNHHPISPVLFLHPLSSGTSIATQSTIEIQHPLCLLRPMIPCSQMPTKDNRAIPLPWCRMTRGLVSERRVNSRAQIPSGLGQRQFAWVQLGSQGLRLFPLVVNPVPASTSLRLGFLAQKKPTLAKSA